MKVRLTRPGSQESHISLSSPTYPTLVDGKTITFREISQDPTVSEWKRVLVNGNIQIVDKKEVWSSIYHPYGCLPHVFFKAINGDLYVIDGTIQDD